MKVKFLIAVIVFAVFSFSVSILIFFESENDLRDHSGTVKTIQSIEKSFSSKDVVVSERINLPLRHSAPETNVAHTINIDDIRRGCGWQDCIPSIDSPEFVLASDAFDELPPDSIGIALSYKGEHRFYPFPMLESRELVNDRVAGDPLLISYCPLCGTGIVFDRTLGGKEVEFGVSGMLWQSNLLMYNRARSLEDRNLWSQVLGEAVVGKRAGEKLNIIPSDIMRFSEWSKDHINDLVLTTGNPTNPYRGEYFRVASSFEPDFDPNAAEIAPDAYVYGVVVDEQPAAIPRDLVPVGQSSTQVNGVAVVIHKSEAGAVTFSAAEGAKIEAADVLKDVEGFWFSWQAAHPDTIVVTELN